jgi:hypothetical protein
MNMIKTKVNLILVQAKYKIDKKNQLSIDHNSLSKDKNRFRAKKRNLLWKRAIKRNR